MSDTVCVCCHFTSSRDQNWRRVGHFRQSACSQMNESCWLFQKECVQWMWVGCFRSVCVSQELWLFQKECAMRVVGCNRKSVCNEECAMKESCFRKNVCSEGELLQKEYMWWRRVVAERMYAVKDGCWLFQKVCVQWRTVVGCFRKSVCNEGRLLAVSEWVCAMKDGCWLFQNECMQWRMVVAVSERVCAMKDGCWLFQNECMQWRIVVGCYRMSVCNEGSLFRWLLAVSECVQWRMVGCFRKSVCNEGRLLTVSDRVCAMKDGCWLFQKACVQWRTVVGCFRKSGCGTRHAAGAAGLSMWVSIPVVSCTLSIVPPLLQRKARTIKGSSFETLE